MFMAHSRLIYTLVNNDGIAAFYCISVYEYHTTVTYLQHLMNFSMISNLIKSCSINAIGIQCEIKQA